MAFAVFDGRRGTWSVRWNDGTGRPSVAITSKPPKGWKPGHPRPRKPQVVLDAEAIYAAKEKIAKIGGLSKTDSVSVRDFLDARKAFCLGRGSKTSTNAFDDAFKHFSDWCESQSVRLAGDLTSDDCNRWMIARSQEISSQTGVTRAYSSMKRDRALLAAAWSQAVRLGGIARNPWLPVEVPGKQVGQKRGSWSPKDMEAIMAVSRPWLQNLIIIGCNTGLRIAALLGLEWRDVKFHGSNEGTVTVRKELDKGGKGYEVPMSRKCHDTLEKMKRHREKDAVFVITGLRGKPLTSRKTTAVAIERACERAKLPRPFSPNHFCRRTFGRWAVFGQLTGRPVPVYIVSRWMGHATVKQTEDYLDLKSDISHEWMRQAPNDQRPPGDFQASAGHLPVDTKESQ